MRRDHQEKIAQRADTLRYLFDILSEATGRLSDDTRLDVLTSILDREDLHSAIVDLREVFRSIANNRTDHTRKATQGWQGWNKKENG